MTHQSKYWDSMVEILERNFEKGKCKERGRALMLVAEIELMLRSETFTLKKLSLKEKLKINRSEQSAGSGDSYWDSVVKVCEEHFGIIK